MDYANSFPIGGHTDAGEPWHFQYWQRNPAGPCGSSFNLTSFHCCYHAGVLMRESKARQDA